jgi:hypothetical protein
MEISFHLIILATQMLYNYGLILQGQDHNTLILMKPMR